MGFKAKKSVTKIEKTILIYFILTILMSTYGAIVYLSQMWTYLKLSENSFETALYILALFPGSIFAWIIILFITNLPTRLLGRFKVYLDKKEKEKHENLIKAFEEAAEKVRQQKIVDTENIDYRFQHATNITSKVRKVK